MEKNTENITEKNIENNTEKSTEKNIENNTEKSMEKNTGNNTEINTDAGVKPETEPSDMRENTAGENPCGTPETEPSENASRGKKKMKVSKKLAIILIVFTITCIAVSPIGTYLRSMAVMGIYSKICEADGIPADYNFELDIPGGGATFEDDWYPFVMTFNADSGFSRHVGVPDSRLTILYNFPSFSFSKGCSRLYDTESPYYSGFYGAYLVNMGNGEPYGVDKKGNVNPDEVATVSMYDYRTLVLSDFGLSYSDFKYDFSTEKITYNHEISGIEGWTRCSGKLTVPGCSHVKNGFVQSYLQYGPPEFECADPFAPVEMESIIYAKYFEEINTGIFLYIMVPGEEEAAVTEEEILRKTSIMFSKPDKGTSASE